MDRPIVKIERAKNGYEVEMCDPKIKEKNESQKGVGSEYRDPYVSFVFKTVDEVMAFLEENLEKAVPMDDFETSFNEAVKED